MHCQHSRNLVGSSLFIFFSLISRAVSSAAVLGCLLLSVHQLSVTLQAAMLMLPPLLVPWWPPAPRMQHWKEGEGCV